MTQGVKGYGCMVESCDRPHWARGYCRRHYEALPERRAAKRAYDASPRSLAKKRSRNSQPEQRAKNAARNARRRETFDAWRRSEAGQLSQRRTHLKKFGLTIEQFNDLLAAQGNKCAICQSRFPGRNQTTWPIDHDHANERVRGLLCHDCNLALGYFHDDPELLAAAIRYLAEPTAVRLLAS